MDGGPAFRAVARAIEAQILGGAIRPGEALPAEARIAESMGVNRSTVREAIRALEQAGFVRREEGRKKLRASVPRSADISRRMQAALVMDQITFEELWETMLALEPPAAALAARRRNEADLAALEANLGDSRLALEDSARLTELDIAFHELIARAAGNRAMQAARLPVGDLFYPPFLTVISRLNASARLLYAHEQLVAAIRAQDEGAAREWMEKHIHDFRRGYELANLDMGAVARSP